MTYKVRTKISNWCPVKLAVLEPRSQENPLIAVNNDPSKIAISNPIIIPAAGRDLHNPFFSGAGPFYHMLVVIGYSDNGFITNDPGTKQGEQYWYSSDVLLNALHDWIGVKELIATGPNWHATAAILAARASMSSIRL